MSQTYLTTQELAERIKYDVRTIRNQLKDSVLIEGIHYIRHLVVVNSICLGAIEKICVNHPLAVSMPWHCNKEK